MRVARADLANDERAVQTMVLCNNLEGPVDIALWEYASSNLNIAPQDMVDSSERLAEELFTSETKYMITEVTGTFLNGDRQFFLKGAPEIVLKMCHIDSEEHDRILTRVDEWAGDGLRLLGLAYRQTGKLEDYSGYTWVGLLGMQDPVRDGVQDAVDVAQKAGIQIKMITGDYRRTAEKIGRTIGLLKSDGHTLGGEELSAMSDLQLQEQVKNVAAYSRIRPQDKLRIVKALQANGEITAMIGDGVNDAPALQRADIGVVVGTASDVAKETADLILMDSNFRTIVAAIEEGRVIFENIRKVVAYTLSNSFAEVLTIFVAMMLHWPAPLAVAQILWIHLICDGPSDIVLGFEPEEEGIMNEKPKSIKEPVLAPLGLTLIGVISIGSAIAALALFGHYYLIHHNIAEGQSLVFASFAVNSMIYIFAYRSMRLPLLRAGSISRNIPLILAVIAGLFMVLIAFAIPSLRSLLGIVPLSLEQWGWIAAIAFGLLVAVEVGKWVRNLVLRHSKNL
jgi:Ca2+-transporting ATPase